MVLERWWHADCDLPPLVRAGLAHVQFETIYPFLDGSRPHRLAAVRSNGDWEGWVRCFLECVREAADGGVRVAQALHALVGQLRRHIIARDRPTVAAIELREHLPSNPIVTVPKASELLALTAPPTRKAIALPESVGVLREITGKRRGRAQPAAGGNRDTQIPPAGGVLTGAPRSRLKPDTTRASRYAARHVYLP